MEITDSDNVLVDSSIWIEFFRGNEPVRSTVNELIDKRLIYCTGLIVGELIQGAKSKKEIDILNEFVLVFEFFPENLENWIQAGYLSLIPHDLPDNKIVVIPAPSRQSRFREPAGGHAKRVA